MRNTFFISLLLATSESISAATWYVSPTGTNSNTGTSTSSPWDLKTALRTNAVTAGDVIRVLSGTNILVSGVDTLIKGTPSSPIVITNHVSGEYIHVQGLFTNTHILGVISSNLWFYHLDVFTKIQSADWPTPPSQDGIYCTGQGSHFYGCQVHDCGMGLNVWGTALDSVLEGCMIYNNGISITSDHGTYSQNNDATHPKEFTGNYWWQNSGANCQWYGATVGRALGYNATNNASWNSGGQPALLVGGNPSYGINIISNYWFTSASNPHSNPTLQMSYAITAGSPSTNANIVGNYIRTITYFANISYWTNLVFTGNTCIHNYPAPTTLGGLNALSPTGDGYGVYSVDNNNYHTAGTVIWPTDSHGAATYAQWKADTGFDSSSTQENLSAPYGVNSVFVVPMHYTTKRANIVIFNNAQSNSVSVDPSSVLALGDSYELRDAENFWSVQSSGTWSGGTISVVMTNTARTTAILGSGDVVTHPDFGAFVLIGQSPPTVRTTLHNATLRNSSL